jgi:CheY-like chemotaxis protein
VINTSKNDTGPGLRILLVDDNEDASTSMAELLTLCGHDVRTAGDGAQALEAAAQFAPQLVLSDIGLPGMDGYQLAPALRRLAGSRRMVMAAVTGYGQAMDRERAISAGFDHHLVKPLAAETLLGFIDAQAELT